MPRVEDGELGPIASEVVYEDDDVRVWINHLAPGEASPRHRHELDYVIVDVAGDRIAAEGYGDADEYLEAPVRRGQTSYLHGGGVERAVNVGRLPYRTVIVELKHD
jgi:hypothetical protein